MWRDNLCPFDLETSGVNPTEDHVLSACVGHIRDGVSLPRTWLACPYPDFVVPEGSSAVNGLTTEFIREQGRPSADVLAEIVDSIVEHLSTGAVLVGHNLSFDLTTLHYDCLRFGVPTLTERLGRDLGPCVDTMTVDRHLKPFRRRVSATQGPYQLRTAVEVWGRKPDGTVTFGWDDNAAHEAEYDATMAARVAWVMADDPAIRDMTIGQLHVAQIGWAAEQAADLREYFNRVGKPEAAATVDGTWPIRTEGTP
jgi:DNA polymerase III subunit epsilon